ncbi:MAG: DUF1636 domain-containing protein [Pseudomonadota bacterium]
MSARLIICNTCKRDREAPRLDGKTCGEELAEQVKKIAGDLRVEQQSCLMGCERACNIALSAPGKLSYVLGKFDPTEDAATAIVEYARLYQASETGQVPYRTWPEGVKGHFVARIPPDNV